VPNEILFPDVEPTYVFDLDCLAFRAIVDGRPIECLVTAELLLTRFGARDMTEASLRETYRQHRPEIQVIASGHIEHGWIDDERRVFLTTRFTRLTVTYDEKLRKWREGLALAESAASVLIDIIGPNAEAVTLQWGVPENMPSESAIQLRLVDPEMSFSVSVIFGGLPNKEKNLSLVMGQVWASFLRERSRRLNLKSG
jgi:Protein of unknown function (DUF1488)